MEQKKITTFLIGGIIILIMGVIAIGSKNKGNLPSQTITTQITTSPAAQSGNSNTPIFFYGNTCPHCADVEKWMKENKIEEKITLIKKEVYDNRQNAQELTRVADNCGLPTDSISVPFLYTEGKCLIGTPDIINYLSEKVQVSQTTDSAERKTE